MRCVDWIGLVLGLGVVLGCSGTDVSTTESAPSGSTGADTTTTFEPPSGEAGSGSVLTTGPSASTGAMPAESSGGGFVMTPDAGAANECDPTLQDCARGEKCTAWSNDGGTFWNATRCVELGGSGLAGDECVVEGGGLSGIDDCDEGFICLNTNEENVGLCVAFCQGDDLECASGDACAIYNDGVLPLCLPGCDPLLQNCPAGQACIDTPNQTFICFSDASGAGGADGDFCPPEDGENSCDPGQWCGPGSAGCTDAKCCTPYCDLSAPQCMAPDECISFFGEVGAAPPGFEDVGVCVLP